MNGSAVQYPQSCSAALSGSDVRVSVLIGAQQQQQHHHPCVCSPCSDSQDGWLVRLLSRREHCRARTPTETVEGDAHGMAYHWR